MRSSSLFLLPLILTAVGAVAEARVSSATSEKMTYTNYYFARPNDLTIIVNVVGFVQRSGCYEIACDMSDLLRQLFIYCKRLFSTSYGVFPLKAPWGRS